MSARVERHCSANRLSDGPELVNAVTVVAVRVCDNDAVQASDLGRQQLLAQVRPAIDKHALAGTFDEDRSPQSIIPRFIGIAVAPFVPDFRHACRRPAAENPDLQAVSLWAFLNNLKKLAVVASASCSGSSPLSSATNLAVSATNAGSHFGPRCGTGARKGESVSTSI